MIQEKQDDEGLSSVVSKMSLQDKEPPSIKSKVIKKQPQKPKTPERKIKREKHDELSPSRIKSKNKTKQQIKIKNDPDELLSDTAKSKLQQIDPQADESLASVFTGGSKRNLNIQVVTWNIDRGYKKKRS